MYSKNIQVLKLLLKVPTLDVNRVTNSGYSALHWAVRVNNIEGLKLLLDHRDIALWVKSGNRGNLKCLNVNNHFALIFHRKILISFLSDANAKSL